MRALSSTARRTRASSTGGHMQHRTSTVTRVGAIVAGATLALVACSSSGNAGGGNTSGAPAAPTNAAATPSTAAANPCGTSDDITLTVGLFGTFGFKENGLYTAYKKRCPNVTIKEDDVEQSAD